MTNESRVVQQHIEGIWGTIEFGRIIMHFGLFEHKRIHWGGWTRNPPPIHMYDRRPIAVLE